MDCEFCFKGLVVFLNKYNDKKMKDNRIETKF